MRIAQFHVLFAVLFTFLFTIETVHARFSFQTRVDYEGPNPYDVLGLKRSATDNEIKAAYRSLVRLKHHHSFLLTHTLVT
jgi:preprotein translocase subunit Sec63